MSCHHPAVSGFQISIPDKINQFSGYFLLAFSKSGKVKKCHNFILIKKTHRILKFLLNISADCLCGKILLIQIGNLQDQAHIFMISTPSQFTQFSTHLHIIRSFHNQVFGRIFVRQFDGLFHILHHNKLTVGKRFLRNFLTGQKFQLTFYFLFHSLLQSLRSGNQHCLTVHTVFSLA